MLALLGVRIGDDVRIAQQLDTLADADPASIPALIEKIEARIEARPDR